MRGWLCGAGQQEQVGFDPREPARDLWNFYIESTMGQLLLLLWQVVNLYHMKNSKSNKEEGKGYIIPTRFICVLYSEFPLKLLFSNTES